MLAEEEEPTVLFYETFDTQYEQHLVTDMTTDPELKANTILGTDAYKVDGNYYFTGDEIEVRKYLCWKDVHFWPDASKAGIGLVKVSQHFRIKLTTKEFQEVYFSVAHSTNGWECPDTDFFYSFDRGATWQEFSSTNAQRADYYGTWRHLAFSENIGKKDVVYLRAECVDNLFFGDIKVIGYGYSPIDVEEAPATSFIVYPLENGIVVQNVPEREFIAIYNVAGGLVATAISGEGEAYIPLSTKGIYIVKVAGKAMKVVLYN